MLRATGAIVLRERRITSSSIISQPNIPAPTDINSTVKKELICIPLSSRMITFPSARLVSLILYRKPLYVPVPAAVFLSASAIEVASSSVSEEI